MPLLEAPTRPAEPPAPTPRDFRGNNYRLIFDTPEPKVLLSGPAGTGKTNACLTKIHELSKLVPGMRSLIVRKTRESLTETVLVTYEQQIARGWVGTVFSSVQRQQRHSYKYPNGAEIVCGGMDKPQKVMSSEWDIIYCPEMIELAEEDADALTSRLRNRKLPYQQLIGDTNPSFPTHWLKRQCDAGQTLMLETRHEDNPAWHDGIDWTEDGKRYLSILDSLTGPRKLRLRYGRWVQAEGVIYEDWNSTKHIQMHLAGGKRRTPPTDWPVYLSIDFGYSATHPFVCLWVTQDPFGRLWVYRELHESGKLVEDLAREIKTLCDRDSVQPRRVICDHDAEGRATLEKYLGRSVTPAVKETLPSIQAVAARLRPDGDGQPRLYVLADCLVRRDTKIAEAKRCLSLVEEMDSWCWEDNAKKDVPVKDQDDAQDALRYLVYHIDRPFGRVAARVIRL